MIPKYLTRLYLRCHLVECRIAVQSSALALGLCFFPHLPRDCLGEPCKCAGGSPQLAAGAGRLCSPWHCGGCSQCPVSQSETRMWTELILVLMTWNLQKAWVPDSGSSACTKSSAHQPRKSVRKRRFIGWSCDSWTAKNVQQGQREPSLVSGLRLSGQLCMLPQGVLRGLQIRKDE